jgi:hypothetical protein
MEEFGIGQETKGSNQTPFQAGIHKLYLSKVVSEEVGKDKKYDVLSLYFSDIEGIRTFKKSEFAPSNPDADKQKKAVNGFNVRVKHIFESYVPFPADGIGKGAKDWKDYFDKIALAFNTGRDGKPIYTKDSGEKQMPVVSWAKLVYNYKDDVDFPLSPNFIEKITEVNQQAPKTIVIDKKYDKMEQGGSKAKTSSNVMGAEGDGGIVF